ncbi:hypothetical protein VB735_34630 [Halotia wernerae UHCC 0503]|nr:hypothetical protein [Halotia wernerae UHCC 0503]
MQKLRTANDLLSVRRICSKFSHENSNQVSDRLSEKIRLGKMDDNTRRPKRPNITMYV